MLNKLLCGDPAVTWLLSFQFVLRREKKEDGVASVCSEQELHHLNTDHKRCLAAERCE